MRAVFKSRLKGTGNFACTIVVKDLEDGRDSQQWD